MLSRSLRIFAIAVVFLCNPTMASAASFKEISFTIIDFMSDNGLAKKNDAELLKFFISRPACASTIFTTTAAQDYSLVAAIVAMKIAKAGASVSISGLQSFNQQQCHTLSPLKQLYAVAGTAANKVLPDSDEVKALAKDQIDNGKTELEGALEGLPVGKILTEWPCLCDAAFETNLSEEKFAADAFKKGSKLVTAAKNGDVGKVVEIAMAEFGAELGCSLGVEFSQLGQIPVVGDAAFSVCSEFGKAIGWMVRNSWNAGIAIGETLSGQEQHIPVEKYYDLYWAKYLHEDALVNLTLGVKPGHENLYSNCVSYFDSHTASKDSAKQWCGEMRGQLAWQASALVAALKPVPVNYFNDTLKAQVPKLVLEHYKHIIPKTDFNTALFLPNFGPNFGPKTACFHVVSKAIPIKGPHPWGYPGGPKGQSPPLTAWEWACMGAMNLFKAAALDYRENQIPPLISWMKGNSCAITDHSGNQIRFLCETIQGYVACRDNFVGKVTDPLKHCVAAPDAMAKMMAQVLAELGAKRCQVGANPNAVACTRPWKVEKCKALVQQYAPGVYFPSTEGASCYQTADAKFDAAVIEAKGMLDIMNGVDPSAPAPGTSGAVQSIFSQGKPCKHTFDPLSLTCTTPAPVAKLVDGLPYCPPDPNLDGADAPCYDGPVIEGTPGPVGAAANPQLPPSSSLPPGRQQASPAPNARTAPAATPPAQPATDNARAAPPSQSPIPGRPVQVVLEGEKLAGSGVSAAQGRVAAQAMEGFGSHWSGNAQLFWSGGQVGAVMDMVIDVPQSGAYAVVLRLTRAADYADLKFEVDGKASVINFAGYAPNVSFVDVPIGTYPLTAGQHKISMMIIGKQAQSTNYFVGVDRVTLTQLTRSQ